MSCKNVRENLELLDDGELSPHDETEVLTHLAECRECASALESIRAEHRDLTAALAVPDLPEEKLRLLEKRTLEAIASAAPAQTVPGPSLVSNVVVPLVACIAAVVGTIVVGWNAHSAKARLSEALAAGRNPTEMTLIILVAVSTTVLVLAAGHLSSAWNRANKGVIR